MKLDFLRHIVNPIVDKYVELGALKPRDAIEIKKFVFAAEEKYKFSTYGGNPANLVLFLKSSEFKDLVNMFESLGARTALIEVLNELMESYADMSELVNLVKQVINSLEKRGNARDVHVTRTHYKLVVDLKRVEEKLRERLGADVVTGEKQVYASLNRVAELKISDLKQHIKLELKVRKDTNEHVIKALLREVVKIVEEATSV